MSKPGRPLVDVWADGYRTSHGPASADAFRAMIDGLLTTGALPARDAIRATLQQILAPPVRAFDPSDMDSHGLGPPVAEAPREQVTVDRIASFVASSVGARPA